MRTYVPVVIAFLSGFIMVISFFFNPDRTFFGWLESQVLVWVTIIGGFTLLLGGVSITRVNWRTVRARKSGWFYNLFTLLGVFVMAIPAILPNSWSTLFGRDEGSIYDWLFFYIDYPMMATMFAMLAFYIASAAYRAFRARNPEATLLLITATLVMLWRIPMGEALLEHIGNLISTIISRPVNIPELINNYVMRGANLAVQRGILIGAALGAASMSLRILLGIERTYLGKG